MKLIDTTTLDSDAIALLSEGSTGAPQAGDLWMLRLDDEDLGIALLGYVQDAYFSALPVTLETSMACIGAAIVPAEASPLRSDLVVWAPAPNSIGKHLLSHRIGTLCSESDVRRLIHAADGEDITPPFPLNMSELSEELYPDVEYIFNHFAALADAEWVSNQPGDALFHTETLIAAGVSEKALADYLNVPLSIAYPLFHADKLPTANQVDLASVKTGIPVTSILWPMSGPETVALSQPAFKENVLRLGRKLQIGENAARNLTLQDSYALAARQPNADELEMARQRVINSLNRLLGEE